MVIGTCETLRKKEDRVTVRDSATRCSGGTHASRRCARHAEPRGLPSPLLWRSGHEYLGRRTDFHILYFGLDAKGTQITLWLLDAVHTERQEILILEDHLELT